MSNIQCSIHISEVDGKLHIMAKIPDGAESTIAAALTRALIDGSGIILKTALGQNQNVETFAEN